MGVDKRRSDGIGDEVEQRLFQLLGLVTEWLRFAESKTAGLVALTGAVAAGLAYVTYLVAPDPTLHSLLAGLIVSEFCFVASLLVALLSFMPRTDLAELLAGSAGCPDSADNLYFFGDLSKYAPKHLTEALAHRYAGITHYAADQHRSQLDLAAQVVVLARITRVKFRLFTIAACFFGAGAVVAVIALAVALLT